MAEAFNLPVVSHLIPEIHVHLMAAIPNGLTVEYMPWTHLLFEEFRRSKTACWWCPPAPDSAWNSTEPPSSGSRSPERNPSPTPDYW